MMDVIKQKSKVTLKEFYFTFFSLATKKPSYNSVGHTHIVPLTVTGKSGIGLSSFIGIISILLDSKAFWICLIILLISLSIVMSGFRKRCRNCGKWWAMKIIRKRLVDEKASWIKKEFKDKTRDGRIIRTREEAVPATVYTYRIDRQCKHCGHEDYLIKEEKREN